jgi:polar amino acid transport system substrate-binding protein
MGFPWLKPDCSKAQKDKLSPAMRKRCDFVWSEEPLFEFLVVLFKRSDNPDRPSDATALHGKRLCRPEGYYTFDLEQQSLVPNDTITLEQPKSVDDCFELLMDEKVDYVSLNMFTGEDAIRRLKLVDFVESIEDLATTQGLYVIAHKTNPNAFTFMHRFNKGLKELRESGELSDIQAKHLANFYSIE